MFCGDRLIAGLLDAVGEFVTPEYREELLLFEEVGESYLAVLLLSSLRHEHSIPVSAAVLEDIRELMEDSDGQRSDLEDFYPEIQLAGA